jgi:hypothetical protein
MDLRLDTNHDIAISGGDFVLVGTDTDDADEVRAECVQQVLIALKMRRGEYFLDITKGMPYLELSGINIEEAVVAARTRAVVEDVPLVQSVSDVSVSIDSSRHCTINIVGTPFGAIEARI